jgi:polyphosphate kinase 2
LNVIIKRSSKKKERKMGKKKKMIDKFIPEKVLPKNEVFNKKGKLSNSFYEKELKKLQIELVKLQNHIKEKNLRLMILFEGIDAAGKGGTIKRITEHLNPRGARVVALGKPSNVEKTEWYFQRYVKHFPSAGEIVFFDRSWYNRAGVERVMEFCTHEEYLRFMRQCPKFEELIVDDHIIFFKYWLDISKSEQKKRLGERKKDPLKQWKLSPIDLKSNDVYDLYVEARNDMFMATHTAYAPWIVVDANDKKRARINIIRDILSHISYEGKDEKKASLVPDYDIVGLYRHG